MNKWLKLILLIVFTAVVLVLTYVLVRQIMSPLEFEKEVKARENVVVDRIIQIRSAEQAFKQKNQRYTGDWDSLINFVLNDSLVFERQIGSEDDSVAVAKGIIREQITMAVRDTIFVNRDKKSIKLTSEQIKNMRYIPYAEAGKQYILNAAMFTTESKVVVPVFEAKAPYKDFLHDLDHQELVNLIDEARNVYYKYPGIAVGSIEKATNDAGNWE